MSTYKQVFTYLEELYPKADTELEYETPFQLLTAVLLSAQTLDKQVNKATRIFFPTVKTAADLIKFGYKKLYKSISTLNLYKTKAKHLRETAQIIADAGEQIPTTLESLQNLPGVGEKTAKVVAHILYGLAVIPVDTHVHRVANRLGRVSTAQPLQTSKLLEKLIPNTYKSKAHHLLVLFGRYHCMAKKPQCEECKLQQICKFYANK